MASFIVSFIEANLRSATPLLLASLGMLFSERAGIINIGAEGIMLMGALGAVVGSYMTGSIWGGVLFSIITGMIMISIFAFLVVRQQADQIVVGMGLNLLGLGLSTSISRVIFGMNTGPMKVATYSTLKIPLLSKIPFIGEAFFQNKWPVYLVFFLVPIIHFFLFRTNVGLKIRSVGEHPEACESLGINVYRVRWWTLLTSGAFLGFSGSFVSLGLLSLFTENMIAGKGFIALAVVVFGNWKPVGLMAAALLFGAFESLTYKLQVLGSEIPYQFLLMIPYILTILALAGIVGNTKAPIARGKVFSRK